MINSLYIALGGLIIALLALSQIGCTQVNLAPGDYKIYATLTVQEGWCIMPDGEKVNGFTRYNTIVRSVSEVCISQKSDDMRRTMNHELEHVWLNATGNDPQFYYP